MAFFSVGSRPCPICKPVISLEEMEVRTNRKITIALGILSVWPLAYFVCMTLFVSITTVRNFAAEPSVLISALTAGSLLITGLLTIYYLVLVFRSSFLSAANKTSWMAALILFNFVALIVFWWKYFFRQNIAIRPVEHYGNKAAKIGASNRVSMFLCGAIFAIIGPFFGGPLTMVIGMAIAVLSRVSSWEDLILQIRFFPLDFVGLSLLVYGSYLVAFAYGIIPAMIAGLIYAWFLNSVSSLGNPSLPRRLIVGIGIGFCSAVGTSALAGGKPQYIWTLMGVPGAFAGGMCALIITGPLYGWLVSKSSIKIGPH